MTTWEEARFADEHHAGPGNDRIYGEGSSLSNCRDILDGGAGEDHIDQCGYDWWEKSGRGAIGFGRSFEGAEIDGGEGSDTVAMLPNPRVRIVELVTDSGTEGTDKLLFQTGIPDWDAPDVVTLAGSQLDLGGEISMSATYSGIEEPEIELLESDDVATVSAFDAATLQIDGGGGHDVLYLAPEVSGRVTRQGFEEEHAYLPTCLPSATQMCLNGGRFSVEVEWRDFQGQTGVGQVAPVVSDDSGLFWFFDAANWEMLVKVLDGCGVNDYFWVFAAATTNVEYTLRVTDTETDQVREYRNPLGTAADAITDTSAFATCSF